MQSQKQEYRKFCNLKLQLCLQRKKVLFKILRFLKGVQRTVELLSELFKLWIVNILQVWK